MQDLGLLGAIDVGSNGIRATIATVDAGGRIRVLTKERAAVRLGTDAFGIGILEPETLSMAVDALRTFGDLFRNSGVLRYRAVATSAVRTAGNGQELVHAAQADAGISLEIIDGRQEGTLLFNSLHHHCDLSTGKSVLIDLGGGSVEITLVQDGQRIDIASLPLGPVRLLAQLQTEGLREEDAPALVEEQAASILEYLERGFAGSTPHRAVGVGGSLERMCRMAMVLAGSTQTDLVTRVDLEMMIPHVLALPVSRRIEELEVRPDRADIIAIGCMVIHRIMELTGTEEIMVPGVGLREGILMELAAGDQRC